MTPVLLNSREEPAEVLSSGFLENQHASWHDAPWLHPAGCKLDGKSGWEITAADTNGRSRKSQETWTI